MTRSRSVKLEWPVVTSFVDATGKPVLEHVAVTDELARPIVMTCYLGADGDLVGEWRSPDGSMRRLTRRPDEEKDQHND